jgi:hypothetical protein
MSELLKVNKNGQWEVFEKSLDLSRLKKNPGKLSPERPGRGTQNDNPQLNSKAKQEVNKDVMTANHKMKKLGINHAYGVTTAGSPHWDYEYPAHHQKTIDKIHDEHIAPHLGDTHTHEDYADDSGNKSTRYSYGGQPEHVNADRERKNLP